MQLRRDDSLTDVFAQAMAQAQEAGAFQKIGVAVSGGSDSLGLLYVAAAWAKACACRVFAATVDHGLRPAAAREAQDVAAHCKALGVAHDTLAWEKQSITGNLQSSARAARYRLLAEWAKARGLDAVLIAHTRDDVAETFLMRLARGSGVDGLSQMQADWWQGGQRWLRPVLAAQRTDLRGYLAQRNVSWVDDPSNDDPRYARVKMRQNLAGLAELGLGEDRLAATSAHMLRARDALEYYAHREAETLCEVVAGAVVLDETKLRAVPEEISLRIVAQALGWVSGAAYRPRFSTLTGALADVYAGQGRTLHGCNLVPKSGAIWVVRELNAVKSAAVSSTECWDERWALQGPATDTQEIRALGDGILDCEAWRETGILRQALMVTPAIWQENRLIAAPMARKEALWTIKTAPDRIAFLSSFLSH